MSLRNLESQYPKGKATRADAQPGSGAGNTGSPGQPLDKTLENVKDGLPKGPETTPGGHGQVWRDR